MFKFNCPKLNTKGFSIIRLLSPKVERSCDRKNGFSIIELIIVIAVAGAIVLVVANIPNSIGLIGKSKNESIAKEVATQRIEALRGQSYVNLANGTTPIIDTRVSALPGGTATSSIEDCPVAICPTAQSIKKVTVTISWTEKNEPKSVILTTLISDGGLQ